MTTLPISALTQALADLLGEAYAGPPDDVSGTWFVDRGPDSGLLGVLKNMTAAEASRSVDASGKPGSTIAANIEHLRWSLANANGALRGEPYQPNWAESWALIEVNEAQWNTLREALRTEYETLRHAISQQPALPGDALRGVIALIPHAAYHLGLVRQMIERVRQS